jgi:hypothetical protein
MPLGKMSLTISSNEARLTLYSAENSHIPKMTIIYTGESHDYGLLINPNDYQTPRVINDKDKPNNSSTEDLFEKMKAQNNMFADPQIFRAISISFAAAKPFIGTQCEPTLDCSFHWQKKSLSTVPTYFNSHALANIKEVKFYSKLSECVMSIQCNDSEKYKRVYVAILRIFVRPHSYVPSIRAFEHSNEIYVAFASENNFVSNQKQMINFLAELLQEKSFADLSGVYPDAVASVQDVTSGYYTQKLCRPSLAYVKPLSKETTSNINTQRQTF